MNAQDLKNSILQLAVQGKLVEQRAEEGTARELLEQIKLEKDQLIKDKKIKKSKPLPEITEDEIPFEIPESWEWVRLSDVCVYLQRGKSPKYSDIKKIPVIAQKCNQWEGFQLEKAQFIDPDTLEKYADERLLQDKDILINSTGLGTVGRNQIYPASENPYGIAVADSHITVVRLNSTAILPEYFFHYWRNPSVQLVIEDQTSGSTKQKELALATIQSYIVPLPPLEEQHRIVAKIEEILPYIDQYDKAYTKLEIFNKKFPEDMKKSILQMAMQGKLVEQRPEEGTADELYEQIVAEKAQLIKDGKIKKEKPLPEITEDEIPFEIPSSWKWVRFQEVCAVLTCGYASTPEYVAENIGMPFISAKNIKPYKFMPDDHKYIKRELYDKLTQTCCPKKNDILLTRVGAGIGEAAIIDIDMEFAIYVSLTLIKLVDYKQLDNRYILYWLNSPIGTDNARKNIFGKGASQGNLNVNNVRIFLVPLPPLEEQKRIVAKIEELLPYCDQLIK